MWRGDPLNEYAVSTARTSGYEDILTPALWLGKARFRCQKCRMGYFDVRTAHDHDEECPHCKARVVVRWAGDRP